MNDVTNWWSTAIIDMHPGYIGIRGTPIEQLIGTTSFPGMIWRMVREDMPTEGQLRLFEAALVAAVDHGPQAPSIATARMAVTCGQALNGAMASAVNLLDDVHGGAGEQAAALFQDMVAAGGPEAVPTVLADWRTRHGKHVSGYGHRFHKPTDPRAPRLIALVAEATAAGVCTGEYRAVATATEAHLTSLAGKPIPMNIDGATAVIYTELGFAPPLSRGLFCLSRSVGILAHAWEQMNQGGRNKGPTPPNYRWRYTGPNPLSDPTD